MNHRKDQEKIQQANHREGKHGGLGFHAQHPQEKRGNGNQEAHDQNCACDVASSRELKLQTVRGFDDDDSMMRRFGNLGG